MKTFTVNLFTIIFMELFTRQEIFEDGWRLANYSTCLFGKSFLFGKANHTGCCTIVKFGSKWDIAFYATTPEYLITHKSEGAGLATYMTVEKLSAMEILKILREEYSL